MTKRVTDDAPRDAGVSIRTTKAFRDRLTAAAKESGRSLAQEVEWRLERSFDQAKPTADIFPEDVTTYLKGSPVPASMVGAVAVAAKSIDAISKDRKFTEMQAREALRAAFDVIKYFYLWVGEDAPELDGPPLPFGTRVRDYPPQDLGYAVAWDRIVYNSAWNDEDVPQDTADQRIMDHWTGDGTEVLRGPTHAEVEAQSAEALAEGKRALATGEIEYETPENLAKHRPQRDLPRRPVPQTPLKDIMGR
jgi:hypothetical protein